MRFAPSSAVCLTAVVMHSRCRTSGMIMRGCVSQAGGNLVQLFTILLTMTAFQPYVSEVALPILTFGSVLFGVQMCSIAGSDLSPRAANGLGRVRLLVLAVLPSQRRYHVLEPLSYVVRRPAGVTTARTGHEHHRLRALQTRDEERSQA